MHAMVLEKVGLPLVYKDIPVPVAKGFQVLIKVKACGVCQMDLLIIDGELTCPKLPLVPGHGIIGRIVSKGATVTNFYNGDLVGVPWLGHTCGYCKFCLEGKENLCDKASFTGYTINGGFAEYVIADIRFCISLGAEYDNPSAAALLCTGLIGYRSFSMIEASAKNIGIYGFGQAAQIITRIAKLQGKRLFAFTRETDQERQVFALRIGADWAGNSNESPPEKLDAAIIFAPGGELIPKALMDVDKGGQVICAAIQMTDVHAFPYHLLWEERSVRSVTNTTRQDNAAFFELLKNIPVHIQTELFELKQANEAILKLRHGKVQGSAVLIME